MDPNQTAVNSSLPPVYGSTSTSTWVPDYKLVNNEKAPEMGYSEYFSNSTLKRKMEEYTAGKYTKRYMQAYLEFMVCSGYLDNLVYLEYKTVLEGK